MKHGKVYLVGAGPGDPGLITVKGLDCLQRADVVLYDHLLSPRLLDSVRPEAEKIYVGKMSNHHSMKQDEINRLIVEKAQEAEVVVRLKGGDPFVFGRGGEEAEELSKNNIPFEIVPGISSAVAVPAYAGIPVTHRGCASSFAVVTGHEDPSKGKSSIAWDNLTKGTDTLVFLMGVGNLAFIVESLIAHGRHPSTPIALIRQGTTPEQQTIVSTLREIVAQAEEKAFEPPAVIVVGEVVGLRETLRWFDNQPLFGKRVLVTRARHQASALSRLLLERGAYPIEMPVIGIRQASDVQELDRAISDLKSYHWLVFTSTNGVEAFGQRLAALGLDARHLGGVRIGVIGQATANALEGMGLRSDYVPQQYTSRGFLDGLNGKKVNDFQFLMLRADIASPELADGLRELGAEVHDVTAYRTVSTAETTSEGKEALLAKEIDIVTFASSSTVRNLMAALDLDSAAVNGATVACIGPATADTAREHGLKVDVVARQHTIPGLVEALEHHFQREGEEKEER